MRIGLDFDNTIICYDDVFRTAAIAQGLLPEGFSGTKQDVRDAIRLLENGEIRWQTLQGYVYGQGIGGAHAFAGLDGFLARVRARGDSVVIVSHKTEFGHHDPSRVNLRDAARGWLRAQGFFDAEGPGLDEADVHFRTTREEKLRKIAEERCDVFIDDLEEVLDDPGFPEGMARILFSQKADASKSYPVLADWRSIEEHLFGQS